MVNTLTVSIDVWVLSFREKGLCRAYNDFMCCKASVVRFAALSLDIEATFGSEDQEAFSFNLEGLGVEGSA